MTASASGSTVHTPCGSAPPCSGTDIGCGYSSESSTSGRTCDCAGAMTSASESMIHTSCGDGAHLAAAGKHLQGLAPCTRR